MKFLILLILFISTKSFAIDINDILDVDELNALGKINEIQNSLKPNLKTRGVGSNIFRDNAPRTAIIFSSSGLGEEGLGSGILIDDRGYIVTNFHVIANEDSSYFNPVNMVGFCTNSRYDPDKSSPNMKAEIISYSKHNDLALIKVSSNGVKNITPALLETDTSNILIGDEAHAIGNPNYEYCTYTDGKISQIRDYEWSYSENHTDLYGEVIQTNTEIEPGNSGGPLFNNDGKLIGINSFGKDSSINFAVSVSEVIYFLNNLPVIDQKNIDPNCSLRTNPKTEQNEEYLIKKYDGNCDGYLEKISWDENFDGVPEYIDIDRNANTIIDVMARMDGNILKYYFDENEDGNFYDKICTAVSIEDGLYDCINK